jgi:hypothetical protein
VKFSPNCPWLKSLQPSRACRCPCESIWYTKPLDARRHASPNPLACHHRC